MPKRKNTYLTKILRQLQYSIEPTLVALWTVSMVGLALFVLLQWVMAS